MIDQMSMITFMTILLAGHTNIAKKRDNVPEKPYFCVGNQPIPNAMFSLVTTILFFIGCVLMILERIRFEKKHKGEDSEYISLFREHNTLKILLFAALMIDHAERLFHA